MSPKRLRCFVVGCNNKDSRCHLLPTSQPLKQRITFVFEENAPPPIYLNSFMFMRIIRDPASSTHELSISLFMNLCKSPFLIVY